MMALRAKRSRGSPAPAQPDWDEDAASESSSDAEPTEPVYSSEEDSRRARSAISWTGALEARFLKALQQAGGVWEAKPKAILQRMGAYSTQLTTIQVKSHLQKHRIKVAAQMQQQGLPVPTPSGSSGAGATPAVAAAAQQVAAAAGRPSPRAAPLKVRRPKAPPAGSVVSADPPLQQQLSMQRRMAQQAQQHAKHASAAAASDARHAQQQQPPRSFGHPVSHPLTEELSPHQQHHMHHLHQRQQQLEQQQQQQRLALQQQQRYQRQQLLQRRQQLEQQQQWAGGSLAAPSTPQQMIRFDPLQQPQQLGGEQTAPAGSHGHHSMHGIAHHARHMAPARSLSQGHSLHAYEQHPQDPASMAGSASAPALRGHPLFSLDPSAPAASQESSPLTGPASSGGAPAGSASSDWEGLLRMEALPSPRTMLATRHGSLMRLHGAGEPAVAPVSASQQQQHAAAAAAAQQQQQRYGGHGHSHHALLATHPTAPASLWAAAGGAHDDWPELNALAAGGSGPAALAHPDEVGGAAAMLAPPPHAVPAAHHTSDSDSDHYADLGDLLDVPALLAGGDDAFDAFASGLGSPVRGGGGAAGGLPPRPAAAAEWTLENSPFF